MTLLQKVFQFGIGDDLPANEKKRVQLLNIICANWCLIIILFITLDFFIHSKEELIKVVASHLMQFSVLSFILFLQSKKKYKKARGLFILTFFMQCLLLCIYLAPGKYMEFWYLVLPLFALLFLQQPKYHYLALSIALVGFNSPLFLPDLYTTSNYPNTAIISVLFIVVFLIVNYFKRSNVAHETLLEQQKDLALADKVLIENQKTELEALHDFQNQFFINVAHEIRTPLTILNGHVSKLGKESTDKKIKNSVKQIKPQVYKIKRIVDDVLDLTKMESQSFEMKKESILISNFINKVFLSFTSNFENKNINYQFHAPSSHEELIVRCDPVYLERAIGNVLTNALKYTPEGGNVAVGIVSESKGKIQIQIQDSGIGIKNEDLPKVFNRFYQIDNSINRAGGSGIGLAFSREILINHDGSLEVESQEGKGSTFFITLPVHQKTSELSKTIDLADEVEANSEITPILQSDVKVLLVEDQTDMRAYVKNVLQEYKVLEAENGLKALEILEKEGIHYIVTDYMMPQMDGYELVKEIKSRNIDIPILMLTARADSEAKMRMLRLGIDDYLTKPFEEEELLVRISNGLNNFNSRKLFVTENNIEETALPLTPFIEELEQYIADNCTHHYFGMTEISHHFSMSVSSLYRKVKSQTGLSPKALITEVRLQKARRLLDQSPRTNLKELALEVGFKNYTHFNDLYTNRFGTKLSLELERN
ncbi:MAG: response regulator [Reichenbachiella sp.]|uniref:response regulator n=1 Tax=Reichenbachiella sp. TaxID=2184521 RepID=UPI00329684AB